MPTIDMPLEQLKTYEGRNPRPADFDAYWDRALDELRAVDPQVELIPSSFQTPQADCFDLYFTGVRGARIHAKYVRPRNVEGRHPAVLQFHGYTGNAGDWNEKLAYASLGFSVLALDCRGQGGYSEDVGGVRGTTHNGHIIRGLNDHPDNLLFRHIFLDTAQLAQIALALPEVDPDRVYAMGGSQGGALTIACAALEPRVKKLAPVFPFLCDYKRVWEMDLDKDAYGELRTFFRHFDPLHEKEDEIFEKLGYIDLQYLAERIRGEVLMFVGLMDTICPPSTQFAAYNKMTAPKQYVIYPDFGHEHLPGCGDRTMQFFLEK
ncbi:cephalosporin-C deacetylase [Paenibacillus cellulosilyticus]|uniref:Cephalosporin-C deacetylase n=1 Tax=Paenibacillus cellulosilyticus TaxID=375489 RepID=A0A2V2YMU5_9BACL|nr:alpha/beta fold hydrolase [Paenibacillus cellulosilyticus]PWV95897.1 cephalosporin-C deacetylase [Paenibacillus cellulosilyticus]QKS47765.1 acetylxylan esterase [Paenibacillus cellulosilyticus]